MTDAANDARMIADAVFLAVKAHDGIRREDKGDAYVNHLAEVAAMGCAALDGDHARGLLESPLGT